MRENFCKKSSDNSVFISLLRIFLKIFSRFSQREDSVGSQSIISGISLVPPTSVARTSHPAILASTTVVGSHSCRLGLTKISIFGKKFFKIQLFSFAPRNVIREVIPRFFARFSHSHRISPLPIICNFQSNFFSKFFKTFSNISRFLSGTSRPTNPMVITLFLSFFSGGEGSFL